MKRLIGSRGRSARLILAERPPHDLAGPPSFVAEAKQKSAVLARFLALDFELEIKRSSTPLEPTDASSAKHEKIYV